MNLLKYKNFYLIGIKGVGMTMLAQFLKEKGKQVSGVDIADVFMTDQVLQRAKIPVRLGFDPSKIPTDAVIIYSSAYTEKNNIEMNYLKNNQAKFKKFPLLNYAQAIGALFSSYRFSIAVCGSHGKTTTSAWLGFVLKKIGLDPNVVVGARVPQFNGSAVLGKSDYFIAEADEYQNKLQYFKPYGIVLNNIDYDHPDYFKTKSSYTLVFDNFIKKLSPTGFLVAKATDRQIIKLLPRYNTRIFTYGLINKITTNQQKITLLAHSIYRDNQYQYFQVNDFGKFKIKLLGEHNIENALAVLATACALGLDIKDKKLKSALTAFMGTARRAELMGKYQKTIPIFDDYGHHPTEIKTTLHAFKEAYPNKRLVAIFHPHTFTRTKALFQEFVQSFSEADVLGILEIYGSAREVQGGISSLDLVKAIKINKSKKIVVYLADFNQAVSWLKKILRPNDLVLLIGAGDVFRVGEKLLDLNKEK